MNRFALDVLLGLTSTPKTIPSKYFYDDRGSELFQKITQLPEYYLTRAEYEILESLSFRLPQLISAHDLDIVELGAGDGHKTRLLIDGFERAGQKIHYYPIDISEKAMTLLEQNVRPRENVAVHPLVSEFSDGLKLVRQTSDRTKLVLFLGSNIGNFSVRERREFLSMIWSFLDQNDRLMIGFDLKKDIPTLIRAYNDSMGITREFNLNLLDRMNRELGADFNRDKFTHFGHYDPVAGAMQSFLISTCDQEVHFDSLERTFVFSSYEPVVMEHSYKVTPQEVQELAQQTGFEPLQQFTDGQHRFLETLWGLKKDKRAERPILRAI